MVVRVGVGVVVVVVGVVGVGVVVVLKVANHDEQVKPKKEKEEEQAKHEKQTSKKKIPILCKTIIFLFEFPKVIFPRADRFDRGANLTQPIAKRKRANNAPSVNHLM